MREHKTSPFGEVVDLDDPMIYSYLPKTVKELRAMMFKEIGYFYCYTQFWHKDIFDPDTSGQISRVEKLIKDFTDNERENYANVLWYKEKIFLFTDEIENMC
jgi:hypothetical protein